MSWPRTDEEVNETINSFIESNKEMKNILLTYITMIESRKNFVLGISLGILGNLLVSYIIELDEFLFQFRTSSIINIMLRIIISSCILIYVIYRYYKLTSSYKEFKNEINRSIKLNEEIIMTLKKQLEQVNDHQV